MTASERQAIRLAIDQEKRRRIRAVCETLLSDNPETGYRRGCRCDFCRIGTAEARARRKRRQVGRAAA